MNRNKMRIAMALTILGLASGCVENTGLENLDEPCFTKESLETVPWIVKELAPYQDPRMRGYHAAVYLYNDQQFLAITHPLDCSPIGHVFSCSGVPFDSLHIDANDFSDRRKLVAVLATVKY